MKKFYILITHDITTRLTLVDLGNFRVQTSIIELCRINSINSIIEATNLRHSLELITKIRLREFQEKTTKILTMSQKFKLCRKRDPSGYV